MLPSFLRLTVSLRYRLTCQQEGQAPAKPEEEPKFEPGSL